MNGLLPVLVARPPGRGQRLTALLEERGMTVSHQPFVELVPEHGEELRADVRSLVSGEFSHVAFTSRSAVDSLHALDDGASIAAIPASVSVLAVGPGTAAALDAAGRSADLVAEGSAQDLVDRMGPARDGDRVLFPASAAAGTTLAEGLESRGYRLQRRTAYSPRTIPPTAETLRLLRDGGYSALVLTSAMIARTAAALDVHPGIAVVTIGAPTTAAAEAAGLVVHRQSAQPTDESLADAVASVILSPDPRSTP